LSHSLSYGHPHKSFRHTFMVTVWFGVGQFLSGAMGQLYPGGDICDYLFEIEYYLVIVLDEFEHVYSWNCLNNF